MKILQIKLNYQVLDKGVILGILYYNLKYFELTLRTF